MDDLSWFPPPGSPLEIDMVEYLVNDFTTFESGDMAVFEQHDSSGDDDDAVLVYIFVKIIKCISGENEGFPEGYLVNAGYGVEKRVRSYRLYKLRRQTAASPTEIELFMGGNASDTKARRSEIFQMVEEALVDALKLGMEEFKRVFWRLIRRWHPVKNKHSEFCVEVFKHLMEFAKKLQTKQINVSKIDPYREHGRWDEYKRNETSFGGYTPTYEQPSSNGLNVNDFADNVRRDWIGRQRSANFGSSYSRFTYTHQEYTPNPQPHMARVWIQQAKHDVDTARTTLPVVKDTSCSWICVQCQQVCTFHLCSCQRNRQCWL